MKGSEYISTNINDKQNNMTKRKPDTDLAEEESQNKKAKSGGITIDGVFIEDLIDFSNEELRKKYAPNIDVISGDKITFKYHIDRLVDNSIFNQFINECKHEENKICTIELKLFNGREINMMLNWVHNEKIFETNILKKSIGVIDLFPKLFELAKYLNMGDLMRLCAKKMVMDPLGISNAIINCLSKQYSDIQPVYDRVIEGYIWPGEVLPEDFLSKCFDCAIQKNWYAYAVRFLLPIYCPTDKQMDETFKISECKDANNNRVGFRPAFAQEQIPKVNRFANGMIDGSVIAEVLSKYKYKENIPKGINKLIHKLAELCFVL